MMASSPKDLPVTLPELDAAEWLFFRDRLREARYGALADAEGFQQMCFAFEALGARLRNDSGTLERYQRFLSQLVLRSTPVGYQDFDVLYEALKQARNDAMHTGAYARHAAESAVGLSLLVEEAILSQLSKKEHRARTKVAHFMVRTPVAVEPWHTVGHARRLMLLNSFSFLPIFWGGKWHLLSDMDMAKMFQSLDQAVRNRVAATTLEEVLNRSEPMLNPRAAAIVDVDRDVKTLLNGDHPGLWLVVNAKEGDGLKQLVGVLSPFELM
jgi:hypothetical protein